VSCIRVEKRHRNTVQKASGVRRPTLVFKNERIHRATRTLS
jgi:hypothetical protein